MKRGLIGAIILSLFLVSEAWPQAGRRHLTNPDAHHPRVHSGAHSENGADEVKVEDLASDCSGPIEGDATGGARCGSYPSSPDAEFVVGAAHAGLTSEWVLGTDVLFRSTDCDAETDKAIGAVCFQSDNAGAWRHEGSDSWIQVAAPVPSTQYVLGAAQSALGSAQVLGADVILTAADCAAVTGKPVGAVCLNTGLTRMWRHAGSNTWSEVVLNVQADWNEVDTSDPSFIQNKPTISTTQATNLGIGSRTGTTLDITSSTGTDATVPASTSTQAGLISGANHAKLSDITRGTNPAQLASRNYQWQLSSRDISSAASPGLFIGRNTNSANQRAGYLVTQARDGTNNYLWFDNDGDVCKGTSAPDGTDSNCEAVGVDPQIITMVFSASGGIIAADQTTYTPVFSGAVAYADPVVTNVFSNEYLGSESNFRGTTFPAGTIERFSASAGGQGSTCDLEVTLMRNTSPTGLQVNLTNAGTAAVSSEDTDTVDISAGDELAIRLDSSADCSTTARLRYLSIAFNFIPG